MPPLDQRTEEGGSSTTTISPQDVSTIAIREKAFRVVQAPRCICPVAVERCVLSMAIEKCTLGGSPRSGRSAPCAAAPGGTGTPFHGPASSFPAGSAETARKAVRPGGGWVDGPRELGTAAHAVAVAPDVDHVAAVEQPVEERGGHDLVVQDLSPLLKALVRGHHRRGVLVASVDELEEQAGAAAGDREVTDLVDDQEGEGAVRYIGRPTVARIRAWLAGAGISPTNRCSSGSTRLVGSAAS